MITKSIALGVAGMAVAILLSAPVFAAKAPLSDEAIDKVYGGANDYTSNGDSNTTASLTAGNANVQFNGYQWSDVHTGDQSRNLGANDQSGSASQVQQNVSGQANALFVGSASQNVLINREGPVAGSQSLMAYAAVVRGGI